MTKIINALDKFTEPLGRTLAWSSVAIMLITFLVVVLRYGLNSGHFGIGSWQISSIALQELVIYCHAILFMLASGYTLKHNAPRRHRMPCGAAREKAACPSLGPDPSGCD